MGKKWGIFYAVGAVANFYIGVDEIVKKYADEATYRLEDGTINTAHVHTNSEFDLILPIFWLGLGTSMGIKALKEYKKQPIYR